MTELLLYRKPEDLLKEKFLLGVEPDIDINYSLEKPCEGLFEKEKFQ